VQADAGKTGGPIESLLVKHAQIRQNAGVIGKIAFIPMSVVGATFCILAFLNSVIQVTS
jgi:hypothetical protein